MTLPVGVVGLLADAIAEVLNPTGTVETVWAGKVATRQQLTVRAAAREVNGRMGYRLSKVTNFG
jgi:hypothetical protein